MFNNIQPVTKNLLILNVLMFILTYALESQGINLRSMLGAHAFNSALFEPYQIVSHFFMHVDFKHILMNMFGLLAFGPVLERVWGGKRFFIVYCVSALGALVLYNSIGVFQLMHLRESLGHSINMDHVDSIISLYRDNGNEMIFQLNKYISDKAVNIAELSRYFSLSVTPMMGASGAVFGIAAAFAMLFPNTELQLLFPPIPIKAKYLIGGYFIIELVLSFQNINGDHVAHLAHVGGAIVGAIFVLYWRKKGKNFY